MPEQLTPGEAKPRDIYIFAPSGYAQDPDAPPRAVARLTALGHRVDNVAATERRFERFAGTDAERAADLNRLADPRRALPDIALALRGGYGAQRLLHGLDYGALGERLRDQPFALVGHSDVTALQLALYAQAGIKTFGGPMLHGDFGAETLNESAMRQFWGILGQPTYTVTGTEPRQPDVDVSGTLWGGNLAMLVSTIGTPFMPKIDGGILFVEDVAEQPFRLERMLYQLHLAGVLQRQRALLVGRFTQWRETAYDNGYDVASALRQIGDVSGIPIVTGLDFGHVPSLLTLPFGGDAVLRAGAHDARGAFTLTLSGYPTLR
ncbi:muramoyltetrapeptide carboxypeptidase [Chitinasiproducens palmae]|nr:muramoyltetrapeptide carboxypeptidase [Chitinasiproducens palmae]